MTAVGFSLILLGILIELIFVNRNRVTYGNEDFTNVDDKLAFASGICIVVGFILAMIGFVVWLWRVMP